MKKCTSCSKEVVNDFVEFKCPSCEKKKLVRCKHCRNTSKTYKCEECGFIGP